MADRMGAREARNSFADLLGSVHYGGREVIVERSGKPVVAVIPVETYRRLIAERETRFQVLDRIRDRLPQASPQEVAQDVTEAIAAVRAASAESGA